MAGRVPRQLFDTRCQPRCQPRRKHPLDVVATHAPENTHPPASLTTRASVVEPVPWNRFHARMVGDEDTRSRMSRHRAGVSKATASRVLNGNVQVDPETRDRVLARDGRARLHAQQRGAAPELRAHPHHQRRHVVPDPARRPPSACAASTPSSATASSTSSSTTSRRSTSATSTCAASRSAQRTDGLLVISLPLRDEDVERLSSAAIPVVVVDAHAPGGRGPAARRR